MFAIQKQTMMRRTWLEQQGPQHRSIGFVWTTLARHNGLEAAKLGLQNLLDPEFGPRKPREYRIAEITSGGKVKRVVLMGDQLLI